MPPSRPISAATRIFPATRRWRAFVAPPASSAARDALAGIADPTIRAVLKANTDELIARGGFGSPTVFVEDEDMYFGNDRLLLVRAAVLRRRGAA